MKHLKSFCHTNYICTSLLVLLVFFPPFRSSHLPTSITASPQGANLTRHSHRGHDFSGMTTPTQISAHHVTGHVPYRNSMLTMVLKDSLGKEVLLKLVSLNFYPAFTAK